MGGDLNCWPMSPYASATLRKLQIPSTNLPSHETSRRFLPYHLEAGEGSLNLSSNHTKHRRGLRMVRSKEPNYFSARQSAIRNSRSEIFLCLRDFLDRHLQLLPVHRLGQVPDEPGLDACTDIVLHSIATQRDSRNWLSMACQVTHQIMTASVG
jgi:hypothetical protein